ncbi:MAG TPA: outer membrane lipoprotein-sorting protein [Methylomirabilota bacterium]|nr:outer membrane lipoprotein-sorting protein [Methylomirabilota bacterium]
MLVFSSPTFSAEPVKLGDPVEGQELARELRGTLPSQEVIFNGVLRISAPRTEPREVPIQSKIVLSKESWSSVYTAKLPGGENETLTVRHFPDKPNEYELRRGEKAEQFSGAAATNSFAGSDFKLLDLGLEFFHWPTQMLATREMRKGRGCDVLESRPAQTNPYSRVLSWIDQQSREQGQPGLLMAEAYDSRGQILKEFEIKGFKDGQVSEMEIRNRQTKTSTRLRFIFDKE